MNGFLASVGPISGVVEAIAASIGSGFVIGGFLGGIETMLRGSGRMTEGKAVIGSYIGGVGSLGTLLIDILMRRFV